MAEQKAREAGEKAAKAASKAALIGFFVLLFGAISSAVGGYFGTKDANCISSKIVK